MIYQMYATDALERREAAWLWDVMGVVPANADPAVTESAIAGAGLRTDACLAIGTASTSCPPQAR